MKQYLIAAVAALAIAGPAHADAYSDGFAAGMRGDPLLPVCEAAQLSPTLRRVAMNMGVALYNYNAVTMNWTPDIEWCRAVAWTSSGKRVVNFTVSWTNKAAQQFWVQVTWYSRPIW